MTSYSLRLWLVSAFAGSAITLYSQTPSAGPEGPMPAGMPPTAAPLPGQPPVDEEMIDGIKLTEATIDHVLMLLEDWTGRTVLRPQQLPTPTFAINIKRRLPKSEAIQAMETLLNLNGIGIIPVGDKFMKVVDLPRVRMEAPTMIDGSTLDLPPSGQVMSKLFQLEFQRVTEFLPQINMLLNGNIGGYVVFEKSNAALITDSVSTLQRIELLIKKLDQPLTTGMSPKFYQLRFGAKASDIVNKINAIVQGPLQNQLGAATKFSADDRTNQIVLLSDPRQYPFFDDLIEKLDVKADPNTRNEVIPLKHAASKDVATLLSNLISGQNKNSQAGGGSPRPNPFMRPNGPQPGQPPEAVAPQMPPGMGDLGVSTNEFSSLVNIQPDERSNSVVVSGTVDDIRLIKELVDKVDVLLPQVRIELLIAEVTLKNDEDTGIQALNLDVFGDRLVGFGGAVSGAAIGRTLGDKGPSGLVQKWRNTNTGNTDLAGVIQLSRVQTKGRATILSAPSITTTHNKEGIIIVSTQVPTISGFVSDLSSGTGTGGTSTGGGSSAIGRTSVSEKDIGLTLSVKPLIGNDGSVQLEIKQELSEPAGTVLVDGNEQPIVSRRSTESFITAKSGEIIVLGGLQRKTGSRNRFRLGPIPIIGDLLGGRTRSNERTDLVIFLRPQVLTGDASLDNATADTRIKNMEAGKDIDSVFHPDPAKPTPEAPESSSKPQVLQPQRH